MMICLEILLYYECSAVSNTFNMFNVYQAFNFRKVKNLLCGEHCGVVVRALDSRVRGSGFESRSVRTPLDKAFCPQLSLSTQV